jgi:hypothetical protein
LKPRFYSYQLRWLHHILFSVGIHGTYNGDLGFDSKAFKLGDEIKSIMVHLSVEEDGYVCLDIEPIIFTKRMRGHVPGAYSYMQLLFDDDQVMTLSSCSLCWYLLLLLYPLLGMYCMEGNLSLSI